MADIRDARPDDLDAAYDLLATAERAATGVAEVSRSELAQWWDSADVARYVSAGGGYGAINTAGELVVAGPDSDEMLAHLEERAREDGLPHATAIVTGGDTPFDALVRRAGYAERGEVLRMWRLLDGDLPEPVWASGVTVRTYEPEDAARVVSLLDDAYSSWDDTYVARPLDVWIERMTAHDDFDPAFWFLAERDGELVGCALHWRPAQGRGWVKDLVVRSDQRGTGLGKALLHHGFRANAAQGAGRVGLKVDSTNPTGAVQLYERTGFEIDRRYAIWVKRL
jgi:ribosomal protein S18 acetylase RimI-like enzyme